MFFQFFEFFFDELARLLCLVAQLTNDKPPVLTYTILQAKTPNLERYRSSAGGNIVARRIWNAPSK